ncbi:MAG: hypothetical protein CL489_10770 [Acidobacteria bacterium]|nr:hypothetical protein [Acidobacteriota bacterium]|tara:strand:- start:2392 stop:2673 length:282 start_codon:yes stop_codon:yes gene_type:complete
MSKVFLVKSSYGQALIYSKGLLLAAVEYCKSFSKLDKPSLDDLSVRELDEEELTKGFKFENCYLKTEVDLSSLPTYTRPSVLIFTRRNKDYVR